jgi:hypothetical protein
MWCTFQQCDMRRYFVVVYPLELHGCQIYIDCDWCVYTLMYLHLSNYNLHAH